MLILNKNISNYTEEEINTLILLMEQRKDNLKLSNEIIARINDIKEQINPIKDYCNTILQKSMISKKINNEDAKLLGDITKEIRIEESEYIKLKSVLKNCEEEERNISKREKTLAESIDKTNEEKRERKIIYMKFKKFLLGNLFEETNVEIEEENIEDVKKDLKHTEKLIRINMYKREYLKKLLNEDKISKNTFNNYMNDLDGSLEIEFAEYHEKEKTIKAYKTIKEKIDELMKYGEKDIEHIKEKRKHCSYKQFRRYKENFYNNIKQKNKEILELKQFLTPGLLKSIEKEYSVNRNLIIDDPYIEETKFMIREEKEVKRKIEVPTLTLRRNLQPQYGY